jgi:hypothetical protein
MKVIPNPAPEIRSLVKELSDTVVKGSSSTHVHTALVFVVNSFCNATGTPIEEFYANLVSLRNKTKNPCA